MYKIVNGKQVELNAEEATAREAEELAFEATRKDTAIEQAEELYKDKKQQREIEVAGVVYDLSDSFEFDYQRRGGGNVRVKVKGGKTESKTKQDTDVIETALFTYLNTVADAFDADMDAIETGDYSLSNLRGI